MIDKLLESAMETEAEASKELIKFFNQQGWGFRKEWPTKSGKAIDYLVKAPHDGGHIFFGVECKKDLNQKTKATVLANYLEQASAYSRDLNMPVFLAPVVSIGNNGFTTGGANLDALDALTIFGGRMNVGILVRENYNWYTAIGHSHRWFMVMRGAKFWDGYRGFNQDKLNLVCSTGSAKERIPLKVWRTQCK